ncbi:MAG: 50S ribosomal protein L15 [Acidimicrobiales bacterium]
MKLHDLAQPRGARRPRRRVGRGIAGKGGKTAGRGMKGQKARGTVHMGFEGGQLPLMQRVPKLRGFKNPFRVSYSPVNLDVLDSLGMERIHPEALVDAGVVRRGALVKILGGGEVTKALHVSAHRFSKSAASAITAAGGSVELVPGPHGDRRPPAKGNALTNR